MPPRVTALCSSRSSIFQQAAYIRCLHTSRPGQHASVTTTVADRAPVAPFLPDQQRAGGCDNSLACLPLSTVVRTYMITAMSASPLLLSTASKILLGFLDSKSYITDVERNPVLKMILRETFYKQFCAGENKEAVRKTMQIQQGVGYHGVMLEYALEVLKGAKGADEAKDVEVWRRGLLDSVDAARPGDFVGLKWSGLGAAALKLLQEGKDPSPLMASAIHEVCDAAYAKHVRLLPASEETTTTPTIDKWSLDLQRKYNRGPSGSIVFNTYQAYLKETPQVLSRHIADAKKEGYTFGAKLVRGAYLDHEPRHLIWATKEETDAAYDSMASALIKSRYEGMVTPSDPSQTSFPALSVVLATHNAASARKAVALRREQLRNGERLVPLVYAQLQGMADEVSCELLAAGRQGDPSSSYVPQVYKLSAWGTMKQCLNYLLRRAAENKDAAGRTHESRDAMGRELWRRFRAVFGLA